MNSLCSASPHILLSLTQLGISSARSSLSFSVSTIACMQGTLQVWGQYFCILAPNNELLQSFSMPNPVQIFLSVQELFASVELKKLVRIKLVIDDLATIF